MAKKKDAALSFLEKVMAKIPEDKRSAVKEALSTEDALDFLGEGVLAQEDYRSRTQEVQAEKLKTAAHKANLDDWWEKNQSTIHEANAKAARIAELEAIIAAGVGDNSNVDTSNLVDKKTFEQTRNEFANALRQTADANAQLAAILPAITLKHYQTFGEVIDTNALFEHVRKTGILLDKGGYDSFVADRMKEKNDKEFEKKLADAEKRGFEKAQLQAHSQFPGSVGDDKGAFDFLHADPTKKEDYSVDNAVVELNKLLAGQSR